MVPPQAQACTLWNLRRKHDVQTPRESPPSPHLSPCAQLCRPGTRERPPLTLLPLTCSGENTNICQRQHSKIQCSPRAPKSSQLLSPLPLTSYPSMPELTRPPGSSSSSYSKASAYSSCFGKCRGCRYQPPPGCTFQSWVQLRRGGQRRLEE